MQAEDPIRDPELTIRLFGPLQVQCPGVQEEDALPGQRLKELFAFLLLRDGRPCHRESVAEEFWPAQSQGVARKYLRQYLWRLRNGLRAMGWFDHGGELTMDREWVSLTKSDDMFVDAVELLREHRALASCTLIEPAFVARLTEILATSRGQFLPTCYEEWCQAQRTLLDTVRVELLDRLIRHHEARSEHSAALGLARLSLEIDQSRERTHRDIIRLHLHRADRSSALRAFQEMQIILRDELGVEPSLRSVDDVEPRMLTAPAVMAVQDTERRRSEDGVATSGPVFRQRVTSLRELRAALIRCQLRIARQLERIERELSRVRA